MEKKAKDGLDLGEIDLILVVRDGEQLLRHLDVLERRFPVYHLIENASKRPHIARTSDLRSISPFSSTRIPRPPFPSPVSINASGEI